MSTNQAVGSTKAANARRRPRPAGEKLEPGRVEVPLATERIEQRLKAERIQERLKALPGWKEVRNVRAIDRVRSFPGPHVAAAYAAFAAELAGCSCQPVEIAVSSHQVEVTLVGELTESLLDVAAGLG